MHDGHVHEDCDAYRSMSKGSTVIMHHASEVMKRYFKNIYVDRDLYQVR